MTESPRRGDWILDPEIHFLNHGSFGACPRPVLEHQQRLRDQMEREPVAFMERELPELEADVRGILGGFVKADPSDLVFVTNATSGVNAVLRSLDLSSQDQLLVTDHAYPACHNALTFVAKRAGAAINTVEIPLESTSDHIVDRIVDAVTPRTRLALIDHVSSATAVVFPIEAIVSELEQRGVDTLVDGAHGPGMLPLRLQELGAAYYAGNCHKWVCAPKGAAFLYVRPDRQSAIVPTVISHGYAAVDQTTSKFREMFGWTGTMDPTAALSIGAAIETMESYHPRGWPGVMAANRALAAIGADLITQPLGKVARTPAALSGSMVAFRLPTGYPIGGRRDPLHDRLFQEFRIEVPISPWPAAPDRVLRISAQLYNDVDDFKALAAALAVAL